MKKKYMFAALVFGLSLSSKVMAQVPGYVPTNGLVGWWPFNGNANDESGNGNNGTVNGATLTTDRLGATGHSYSFDGSNYIEIQNSNSLQVGNELTISVWLKYTSLVGNLNWILQKGIGSGCPIDGFYLSFDNGGMGSTQFVKGFVYGNGSNYCANIGNMATNLDTSWHNILVIYNPPSGNKLFIDGILVAQDYGACPTCTVVNSPTRPLFIGLSPFDAGFGWNGKLDDIGIWNRALTEQEVEALYNSCQGNSIISQPTNTIISFGSSAQFSVNSIVGSSYQWQSNPLDLGWQNMINNSTYSGVTTNTLTVANTSLSNHNQSFRAIVNTGDCIDTSDVVQIVVSDTCITNVIVYDTLFSTVTDTLIINTTLGLPAPNNENTILIYPNPASDHITIDNGNYTAMAGYSIKITNNAGQQVFQSAINQAQFYVDLSTWTGNGLYFVHLLDAQNNAVTVRKLVLQ